MKKKIIPVDIDLSDTQRSPGGSWALFWNPFRWFSLVPPEVWRTRPRARRGHPPGNLHTSAHSRWEKRLWPSSMVMVAMKNNTHLVEVCYIKHRIKVQGKKKWRCPLIVNGRLPRASSRRFTMPSRSSAASTFVRGFSGGHRNVFPVCAWNEWLKIEWMITMNEIISFRRLLPQARRWSSGQRNRPSQCSQSSLEPNQDDFFLL